MLRTSRGEDGERLESSGTKTAAADVDLLQHLTVVDGVVLSGWDSENVLAGAIAQHIVSLLPS